MQKEAYPRRTDLKRPLTIPSAKLYRETYSPGAKLEGLIRRQRHLARQPKRPTVMVRERGLVGTIACKPPVSHHDRVIIGNGPEPVVKKPMRILAEGDPIANVVIPRIGELVNVRRIDDAT